MFDTGINGVVVVGIVRDELFEPAVTAATDCAASAHQGIAAAFHQQVTFLIAIESFNRHRRITGYEFRSAGLHPTAHVTAGPDEIAVLVTHALHVHIGELGHIRLTETGHLVAAGVMQNSVQNLVLELNPFD